jgi:hypothetical protein
VELLGEPDARAGVAELVEEVVVAFADFKRRDWLSWGARIMPRYAAVAVEEEREEDRRFVEAQKAQALAQQTLEINEEAKAQRRAVAQDFVEKKIDREESTRRAEQIETARLQKLSALAVESKKVESEDYSMTQDSSASLQAPKAPLKRKSDDNLAGLLAVTGKVSTYEPNNSS